MKHLLAALSLAATLSACATLPPSGPPSGDSPVAGPMPPVFTAHDGRIFDADGKPFVARGVNLQYGDHPARAFPAIGAIDDAGANMIRLQLRRNTTSAQLRKALDEAVRRQMPVMVFYWESDITCARDSALLIRDTQSLWLDRWADVLKNPKYQKWLLLNIANEWGVSANGYADYLATYTTLIKAMRAEGFRAPIVIDAADCGQATDSFLDGRGQALYDADPLRNLIVSVHAYNKSWATPALIDSNIDALKATGVPFMLGEFGDRELVEGGGYSVDHLHLMRSANVRGVGWLAWSWKGNGKETRVLDMSREYGKLTLTRRGEEIVNGPDGFRAQP